MRLLIILLATTTLAFAQNAAPAQGGQQQQQQQQPAPTNRQIWRANMPAGTYELAVSSIIAVTSHEYVVDGAARVTEVNIDTNGQLLARFYYIESAVTSGPGGLGAATLGKVQGLLAEGAERSGTDAWKKVVKSYPTTTHARTVEYRVANKDALNRIFSSASKAFRSGRGEEITISD